MRILYYSPHPTHDIISDVGYSTHQREMISAMRSLGHEVLPVILGGSSEEDFTKNSQQIKGKSSQRQLLKKFIPPFFWRSLKERTWWQHDQYVAGPRLEKAIVDFRPDFIYERSEYSLKQGPVLAKKHGVKHIYEVNAPCVDEWISFEGTSLFTSKARDIEKEKYQLTSGVCPVSSPLGEFLKEEYHLYPNQVQVITNGINLSKIDIDFKVVSAIKEKYKVQDGDVVVGFVGSILAYHGVDELLNAFSEVAKNSSKVKLMIVGDGAQLESLKKKAVDLSIQDQCVFTGKVAHTEVFNYMQVMDICVNPKHSWYGSPIKIFEYAALGKAIIAPDSENIRDVLNHLTSAYLIKEGELKLALKELVAEPSLRLKIGHEAKSQILKDYTWVRNAERVVAFANSLK